jgi:molybdate transport system substrate-binding protein
MAVLRFVSAGAAHGFVTALAQRDGVSVEGSFGAVGAMLERFRAGEPCDVVILTKGQVAQLVADHSVIPETVLDLGVVETSIAVPDAAPSPDVASESALRASLTAADAIYFPDATQSTAGIHFAKVLERLGIAQEVAPRVRTFPNGATAMRTLAAAAGRPIGCTQSTEILATPGVRLVAPLPPGYELETVYTAAVSARAGDMAAARAFMASVAEDASRPMRKAAGFRVG